MLGMNKNAPRGNDEGACMECLLLMNSSFYNVFHHKFININGLYQEHIKFPNKLQYKYVPLISTLKYTPRFLSRQGMSLYCYKVKSMGVWYSTHTELIISSIPQQQIKTCPSKHSCSRITVMKYLSKIAIRTTYIFKKTF